MTSSSFHFSLGTDFFSKLLARIEEREAKHQEWMQRLRTTTVRFGKSPYPSGWVNKGDAGQLVSTGLSEGVVTKLTEAAFWASIKKEEGRESRFSVIYECSDRQALYDFEFENDFIFKVPLDYTADTITKIAPAVPDGGSILATSNSSGKLLIRGFIARQSPSLKVSVIDPGMLTISYRGDNIAVVTGEGTEFIRFSGFSVNTGSMWSLIFGDGEEYLAFSDLRVAVLEYALKRMRHMGHGGTLIIVPTYAETLTSVDSMAFPSSPLYTLGREILKYEQEQNTSGIPHVGTELANFGNMIAKLTAVDGATVLTKDLEIVAFGVVLAGTKRPERVWRVEPYERSGSFSTVNLEDLGNNRHQSAAKYVVSEPESVAVVVSQDGKITGMHWEKPESEEKEGCLYARTNLELVLL